MGKLPEGPPIQSTLPGEDRGLSYEISLRDHDGTVIIPVLRPPQDLVSQYPNRRWNYLTITPTASVSSRGCFLVSGEGLQALEDAGVGTTGPLTISFDTYEGTQRTTKFMQEFYLDQAFPVWGQHSGELDYKFTEGTPSNPTSAGEAAASYSDTGSLWEVYVVDESAEASFLPIFKAYNVRDMTQRYFLTKTCRTMTELWDWANLLKDVWGKAALTTGSQEPFVETTGNDEISYPTKYQPMNLVFKGVPSTLALDVVCARMGMSVRFNPLYGAAHRWWVGAWSSMALMENLHSVINQLKHYRIAGGSWKRYARVNVPKNIAVPFDSGLAENFTNQDPASYEVALEGVRPELYYKLARYSSAHVSSIAQDDSVTVVPGYQRSWTGRTAPTKGQIANDIAELHSRRYLVVPGGHVFYGWHLDNFLNNPGWSALTFSLDGGVARTAVEISDKPPMGMIHNHRLELAKRGLPVPAGFVHNGVTTWEMSQEGLVTTRQNPMSFLGKVISRDIASDTTGGKNRALVKPIINDTDVWLDNPSAATVPTEATEEVKGVWCYHDSWIDVDDIVLCVYVGLPAARWVAVGLPAVRIAGRYAVPDPVCVCDDAADNCPDATATPASSAAPTALVKEIA